MLFFGDADQKIGSVGPLCSNLEARIVCDEEGTVDAEEGAPGELWVRGKTIMKAGIQSRRFCPLNHVWMPRDT
jgi:long-subunit acyl-CoA synthetase (AMP-forming)